MTSVNLRPEQPDASDGSDPDAGQPKLEKYVQGWRLGLVTLSLCFGTLLVAIDTTIIFVAVPSISTAFQALEDIGWYGSAYLLTIMACQAIGAQIFKYFNVKWTYLISIGIFEVGSILCASAPNSRVFIAGRAIAGIGSAGLFQGALCILTLCLPLEKRPLYIGIVVSVFGLASCLGPIVGGALTDHLTWRWCFWINVPCGAATGFLIALFLTLKDDNADRKLPVKEKLKHLDPVGTTVLVGAITCLLLALQWGGQSLPWNSSKIIGLLVGFGILSIIFIGAEWKMGEKATIPLRILRKRSIWSAAGFLLFSHMTLYIDCFYLPFYFQAVQGASVITSGVRFLPFSLIQIAMVIVTGGIVSQIGHYVPFLILGEVICCVGSGLLTTLTTGSSTAMWIAYQMITGIGIGIGMQLPYTAVQVVLSEEDTPIGNGIAIFSTQLGGAIAITAGQTEFIRTLLDQVGQRIPSIPPQLVVDMGPRNLATLAPSAPILDALQQAYATALDHTFIVSLATACAAVPFAMSMEWLNVKTVAKARKQEASAQEPEKV